MNHDQLHLLRLDFHDQGKIYFCLGRPEMVGLLESYPALKQRLNLQYVD